MAKSKNKVLVYAPLLKYVQYMVRHKGSSIGLLYCNVKYNVVEQRH